MYIVNYLFPMTTINNMNEMMIYNFPEGVFRTILEISEIIISLKYQYMYITYN